jgi:hypothetical protein
MYNKKHFVSNGYLSHDFHSIWHGGRKELGFFYLIISPLVPMKARRSHQLKRSYLTSDDEISSFQPPPKWLKTDEELRPLKNKLTYMQTRKAKAS